MIQDEGKSQGFRTVAAKMPREEFTAFKYYCESLGETMSYALRRIILSEIENLTPTRLAGKSNFEYNKSKDNFSWKIVMDDGSVFNIDSNLPANSAEQLFDSLKKSIEKRNLFVKKSKKGSVSVPTELRRVKK